MDFSQAPAFDWNRALLVPDTRRDYGEPRWVALGMIGRRVYVMVYTERAGAIRLISLRRANQRESRYHASQTDSSD